MNILLFIIDALRPDHLSGNGYFRGTSPNIDKLLLEGTSFSNAYCVFPRTDPSMMSIFTGVYSHNHGLRLVSNNKFNSSLATLPEILSSHGYETIFLDADAIHDSAIERGFKIFNPIQWKIRNKIQRYLFKLLHPKSSLGPTEQYADLAVKWIRKNREKKFFLCYHPIDLHWPYNPPNPYSHMFDQNYKGSHDFNTLGNGKFSRGDLIFGNVKLPDEEVKHAIAHYDGGVKYNDEQIGKIMDTINDLGLRDDTLVIITSDHGESFGEHGFYFQHGASLYEPSLKVPLIFYHPPLIPKARRIEQRVSNMSITPSILDLAGIPIIDNLDASSLMPLITGKGSNGDDFIFAESIEEHFKGNKRVFFQGIKGKWRAMIVGDYKIICIPHPDEDIFEIYDLKNDPDETRNIFEKGNPSFESLKRKLLDYVKKQNNEGDADVENLEKKSRELLKKLGYLE